MKIAMVSMNAGPSARLGGLADALALMGHQVTIWTQRDDSAFPDRPATGSAVHVHQLETASASDEALTEGFAAGLAAEWERDRPDVVHAHSWLSGIAVLPVAARFGVPLVQTFEGLARGRGGRRAPAGVADRRLEAEAALAAGCDRIIASSSAEVFELLGLGASPGSIKLIPSGVDLRLFNPAIPRPAPSGAFRLATLSGLAGDAGIGDVLEALTLVADVELVVGGGRTNGAADAADSDMAELERLARFRGLDRRVRFAGPIGRDEAPAFLRAADAVICVPRHDSTGALALEAMACGVPVIVSAVGALVDIVADGMTGVQVPPNAPRQLAYAIESLRTNLGQRERLGRFAAERAAARYGWSRIAAETFTVYESVALSAPGAALRSCS